MTLRQFMKKDNQSAKKVRKIAGQRYPAVNKVSKPQKIVSDTSTTERTKLSDEHPEAQAVVRELYKTQLSLNSHPDHKDED